MEFTTKCVNIEKTPLSNLLQAENLRIIITDVMLCCTFYMCEREKMHINASKFFHKDEVGDEDLKDYKEPHSL